MTGPPQVDGYGAYGGNYGGNGAVHNVWMQGFPRAPQFGFTQRPPSSSQYNNPRPSTPQVLD
jgi:hypothetical protein